VTVTDNHDLDRLPFGPGATDEGLSLAYTFLLTTRGIPQLYYGNEIGLDGGSDPDNRRDFPGGWRDDPRNAFETAGRDAREQRIFTYMQRLLRLRRERPELRDARTEHLLVEEQVYAYRRGGTVVVINNGPTGTAVLVPGVSIGVAAAIGACGVPRKEGDGARIEIGPRSGCVF
jgi:glycosidase